MNCGGTQTFGPWHMNKWVPPTGEGQETGGVNQASISPSYNKAREVVSTRHYADDKELRLPCEVCQCLCSLAILDKAMEGVSDQ
jgi:hypothetical protein